MTKSRKKQSAATVIGKIFVVIFVLHIAHNGLQQILHGYDSIRSAVFIHHDRHLNPLFRKIAEKVDTAP